VRRSLVALLLAGGLVGTAGALVGALLAGGAPAAWAAAVGGALAAVGLGGPAAWWAAGRWERAARAVVRSLEALRVGEVPPPREADHPAFAELARAAAALAAAEAERRAAQRRLADAHAELLRRHAATAALEERQRIARELHDAVSQRLFGLHLLAAAARRGHPEVAELAELERLSQEAQGEMRALLRELRPPALDRVPLAEALRRLVAEAAAAGSAAWTAEVPADLPDLGPAVEDGLYRIAQEAVANVQRHAAARRAVLRLRVEGSRLRLVVDDDGCGFRVGEALGQGMGLGTMRERAAALGAAFGVRSQPGRGTVVEVVLPLLWGGSG